MKTTSKSEPQIQVHALSSGVAAVLPGESLPELQSLIGELNSQFEPKTGAERFLVDQMVHARWKLARFRRLEAEALERIVEDGGGTSAAVLDALRKPANILEKLERWIAAQDRAFSKAVRDLNLLRAAAAKAKKQNEANAAEQWLQAELAKLQNEPDLYPPSDCHPGLQSDARLRCKIEVGNPSLGPAGFTRPWTNFRRPGGPRHQVQQDGLKTL